MISGLWNRLHGYERLKERGDHLFLAGEFERARREYLRARSLVSDHDTRSGALDSLIQSCERQSSASGPEDLLDAVPPSLDDFFELAIGDKPVWRAEAYRILGQDFRAGYVALVQGRAERAVSLLEKAAARSPSAVVVHLELGRARSLAGRMEEAREALSRALTLSPEDEEGRLLAAAVDVELGRFEEARGRLLPLAERGGERPEVSFLLGRALAGLQRFEEALAKFRETVAMEPRFHEAFFEAGRLLEQRGDTEAAFQLLNRATVLAPDEARYNRELAALVLSHPFDEEAGLAACDRLMLTDEENRWQYLHWIAELYIRRGWKREARDPLQKALALIPPEHPRERQAIEERLRSLSNP